MSWIYWVIVIFVSLVYPYLIMWFYTIHDDKPFYKELYLIIPFATHVFSAMMLFLLIGELFFYLIIKIYDYFTIKHKYNTYNIKIIDPFNEEDWTEEDIVYKPNKIVDYLRKQYKILVRERME